MTCREHPLTSSIEFLRTDTEPTAPCKYPDNPSTDSAVDAGCSAVLVWTTRREWKLAPPSSSLASYRSGEGAVWTARTTHTTVRCWVVKKTEAGGVIRVYVIQGRTRAASRS